MKALLAAALLLLAAPAHAQVLGFVADMTKPSSNRDAPAFATLSGHGPDAVFLIGDMPHPGAACGKLTASSVKRMHCEVHGLTGGNCNGAVVWPSGQDWLDYLDGIPTFAIYDDHESLCNNSDKTSPGMATLVAEHQAFYPRDAGVTYPSASASYHTVVTGHVRVIVLDTRAQREPYGTDGATAMLGAAQQAWFESTLAAATETWVVIVSPQPLTGKPLDAWESKPIAQAAFEATLTAHCNVRCGIVSADYHLGGGVRETAWGADLLIPHVNLPDTIKKWGSCGNTQPTNCGTWDALIQGQGRPGFGLVTATSTTLTLEARKALDGAVRVGTTLTVP